MRGRDGTTDTSEGRVAGATDPNAGPMAQETGNWWEPARIDTAQQDARDNEQESS